MNFRKLCLLVVIACVVFGGGIYYFKNLPEQPIEERGIIAETATHKLKILRTNIEGNIIAFDFEVINKTKETLKFETEDLEFSYNGKSFNAKGSFPDPLTLEVPADSRKPVYYFIQREEFKELKPGMSIQGWKFTLPLKKNDS